MSLEINPKDVVKLILQYCKENGFFKAFHALQEESHVSLNTIDSVEAFKSDIIGGKWDAVLKTINHLSLPHGKFLDLHEQIIFELLELGENDTAKLLIKEQINNPNYGLRLEFPDRCARLDYLIDKQSFDPKEVYPEGVSKEKRRMKLADQLIAEIVMIPNSKLLSLLGELLKYQVKEGIIPANVKYDIFTGANPQIENEPEAIPSRLDKVLKYGADTRIEIAKFSHNGKYLATGSVDGIIEILDPFTGKLKTDLPFQAEEAFMVHNTSIISLAFSNDDELLASGSKNGQIKVWRIINGNCLRKYDNAHKDFISCLYFPLTDEAHLISASNEIRVYGLKSGKMLKEFHGHDSKVHDLFVNREGTKIYTGGSDGVIKIWDYKTTECLANIRPQSHRPAKDSDILALMPIKLMDKGQSTLEGFIVCSKNLSMHLLSMEGVVLKSYKGEKLNHIFEGACISSHGSIVYGLSSDGYIYCYDVRTTKPIHSFNSTTNDIIGITHHPTRNILIVYDMQGNLTLFKH